MMILGMILALVVAACAEYGATIQHEELRLTGDVS